MRSLLRIASVLGLLAATLSAAAAEPRRIVSFNLCADQLVLALADPEQIAGLSPYAADPALSIVADKARQFRRLDWQSESTIALSPDLVLVGFFALVAWHDVPGTDVRVLGRGGIGAHRISSGLLYRRQFRRLGAATFERVIVRYGRV